MVTVMRDVTDLRRADQELRQLRAATAAEEVVRQDRDRLNLIIENVGDPIVVCDSDAKIVLLDPLAAGTVWRKRTRSARCPRAKPGQARRLHSRFHLFILRPRERAAASVQSRHEAEVEYDARSGKIYDERGRSRTP